ncbi:MAG TPA: A/G-specific adenine glycosylase [Stellaceae bacterium]|nr:A/G-specific adenine glycosylase [Stellaceae bacterium]
MPIADALLAWYDRHRRSLPWRAGRGERTDPYRVWLSEVMLQQTTVVTVLSYYEAFLERWPDVAALAAADLDEVLHAWQGLGYYARARNLHACARDVVARFDGRFPDTEAALLTLPGIGAYSAAAVAAIAFDRPVLPVDGNVERVVARLFAVATPLPEAKPELRRLAASLTPTARPGDFAQAMMDLGATICVPRAPKCILCPLRSQCRARREGIAETLPARRARPEKPVRYGVAFWAVRVDGAVLLRRRAERGLLGGMMEVPSTEWRDAPWRDEEAKRHAPLKARWHRVPDRVRHTFTHFQLELSVLAGTVPAGTAEGCVWVPHDRLGEQALPSLMRKVIAHAGGVRVTPSRRAPADAGGRSGPPLP